ncbi:unnamed protein product [Mesocestoides corti]|uniref:Aldedh domain-containing protein n=1 Tax=Mesocestoides corti TaxID=53468 RepID=A0A0R3U6C3_MESCO|nr:unnamed protein product [Mesocestoides corti]
MTIRASFHVKAEYLTAKKLERPPTLNGSDRIITLGEAVDMAWHCKDRMEFGKLQATMGERRLQKHLEREIDMICSTARGDVDNKEALSTPLLQDADD